MMATTKRSDDNNIVARDDQSSSSDDFSGDTFSIDSSITAYRIENGRRYHAYKDGTYWAPNDDRQNENLDISHHKYLLLLDGKLLLAPIRKDIKRVLDLGTGTGIWAIDFADEYPDAEIIGTDLSPIQPEMVPPNCRFEIDDARDEWTYPRDYFDLIHIRSLFGSIRDWPALYGQIYRHLKPGAFFEQMEVSIQFKSDDGTVTPGSPLRRWSTTFTKAGEMTGQSFAICETMTEAIKASGFVNVVETVYKAPLGGWPRDPKLRDLGRWGLLSFQQGIEGYAMALLTRVYQWNPTEVQVFLAEVRTALYDRSVHPYHEIRVVYAQKPDR
ncbi:mRNA 3'-end-processing protein yth1 [Phlyctema vagabunda]|uniref:mRNA 3'-end-processing protein yth1 n=1 Tax=Phlyctema vagabunda TaxID=108571 RepID=A0ABR4P873_9HELO